MKQNCLQNEGNYNEQQEVKAIGISLLLLLAKLSGVNLRQKLKKNCYISLGYGLGMWTIFLLALTKNILYLQF